MDTIFDLLFFRFFQKYNFPGIIGCIDCTHVAIFPPKINDDHYPEHIYVNRKNYHSINVQLVNMHIIISLEMESRIDAVLSYFF